MTARNYDMVQPDARLTRRAELIERIRVQKRTRRLWNFNGYGALALGSLVMDADVNAIGDFHQTPVGALFITGLDITFAIGSLGRAAYLTHRLGSDGRELGAVEADLEAYPPLPDIRPGAQPIDPNPNYHW